MAAAQATALAPLRPCLLLAVSGVVMRFVPGVPLRDILAKVRIRMAVAFLASHLDDASTLAVCCVTVPPLEMAISRGPESW